MTSIPAAKRKRTEDSDEPEFKYHFENITRSNIWWEDGNIIFQAENTQFRIHRSLISNHSSILKNRFNILPFDSRKERLVEGCPVVLVPESVEDWWNLLATLYQNRRIHPNFELPLSRLLNTIRIGQKYKFERFRDPALHSLKTKLPTTYEDWVESFNSSVPSSEGYFTQGNEIDLVNFATELRIYSILPIVDYICIRDLGVDELLDGAPRRDGTIAKLTTDSRRVLLLARERVFRAIMRHPFAWLKTFRYVPCLRCTTPILCNAARGKTLEETLESLMTHISNALNPWNHEFAQGLCKVCTETAETAFEEGRRELWEELPIYFKLPRWGVEEDFSVL